MTTDYERYIRTDDLLALQKPPGEQVNHDELLFQATHQASKLWMKAVLQDLKEAVRFMCRAVGEPGPSPYAPGTDTDRCPSVPRAVHLLRRAAHVLGMVAQQILILEWMAPADSHQIRTALGRGSGQDSPGYNRILGMAGPLREACQAVLARRNQAPAAVLGNPYEHGNLHALLQALAELDEQLGRFRQHHLDLVKRQIGLDVLSLKGAPASKLVEGTRAEMFPDLWAAVSEVTNTDNPSY